MNVAPINAAKAPFDIATEVLWQNRWDNRAEALRITIGTLVNDYGIAEATAEVAAIQAFADLDSINLDSTIDLNASTAHVVVLRTRNGCPVVVHRPRPRPHDPAGPRCWLGSSGRCRYPPSCRP
ncbi:hypothetical protein [Vreelandella lionensis]|uniref:hypothetical protein n=1 Tax=Vreelandella lionensis TaxID=1144478 RepID=UPI0009F29D38|nr:hypothetical protein [Halomonas lionensis]